MDGTTFSNRQYWCTFRTPLAEINMSDSGEYKTKVLHLLPDESETECRIYSFMSAWPEVVVLQILANTVTVNRDKARDQV